MIRLTEFLLISTVCSSYGAVTERFSRVDIFQPYFHQTQRYRDTRSVDAPNIEVILQLPPEFKDVESFRKFFGAKPERRKRDVSAEENRDKRGVDIPTSSNVESSQLLVSNAQPELPYASEFQIRRYPDAVLEIAERPTYSEFVNPDTDAEDPRKRRNTSANDHEDKRTYPDVQEPTTTPAYWKKNNPPFVTSRDGRTKTSAYDNAQHRSGSAENARESHSMKEPPKSMSSNEITRMQDNYYSGSSTRRAYNSGQSDSALPKSVYDTLDYSTAGRRGQSRNVDSTGRLTESNGYGRPYNAPRTYDRYYYPLPGDIGPRGADFYHRTVDPGTGRIIYYATLPEPSQSYDPYWGRTLPPRSYTYDAYGRGYPAALPMYPAYPTYVMQEYMRNGRNIMEQYQQPKSDYDRYRDDPRNKTYVIYDAQEKTPAYSRPVDDLYRYAPPPQPYPTYNYASQPNYYNYQQPTYQPSANRGNYYPEARRLYGSDSNTREVQIPMTSRSSTINYDKQG